MSDVGSAPASSSGSVNADTSNVSTGAANSENEPRGDKAPLGHYGCLDNCLIMFYSIIVIIFNALIVNYLYIIIYYLFAYPCRTLSYKVFRFVISLYQIVSYPRT